MKKLILFTETDKNKLLNKQSDKSKFGNYIHLITETCNIYEQLKNLDVDYVLFGIPEDVGVFANYGKSGTSKAWEATIKILINTQNNNFNTSKRVAVLGYLDFINELETVSTLNHKKASDIKFARKMVADIDKYVTQIVYDIVKAGKKPIIIGGGQNNAYGNIKGTSLALNKAINIVNLSPHFGFMVVKGRHNANPFSYAHYEGFLDKYYIFGIHENDTSSTVFRTINRLKSIDYNTFEAIEIRKELKFKSEIKRALEHVSNSSFGIEINCNAIQNIASSEIMGSGFSINKARSFLHLFAKQKNATYLHISEAAPGKKNKAQIGLFIANLITDFIKSNGN